MTRTGVSHTDTASGKGHGQLTENPGAPEPKGKPRAKAEERPAPSGQMQAQDAPARQQEAKPTPRAPSDRR